jgi:type VI secretion system protein ImpI
MGKGLRVQVTNAQDGTSFERTFDDFPVRIGRDPLNELPLDYPFVSKFHAVVDLRGDRLILRDLGSRNGTVLRVPTERIPPNEAVDLATTGNLFGIASVRFEVAVVDVDRASSSSMRRARGGAVLAEEHSSAGTFVGAVAPPPGQPPAPAVAAAVGQEALRAELDAWREAWSRLYARLSAVLAPLGADERVRTMQTLARENAALAKEPDFLRLAHHLGVTIAGAPAPGATREESVALLVLRDLASWYVDSARPPQTAAQLVAFGRKLQDVLDALFVSFIPLRDGLRKFETEFDVRVGVSTHEGAVPAEIAANPAELAARLLDWNDANDSGRVVRRVFANLMVHNVGLVNGVMRGAAALLEQLSPATLEEELEAERARGRSPGITVGPWRFRALWDVLKRRHDDLSHEEQERFALLFGQDFASAYSALTANARMAKTPEVERSALRERSNGGSAPPQGPPLTPVPPPPGAPIAAAPPPAATPTPLRAGPTGTLLVNDRKGERR